MEDIKKNESGIPKDTQLLIKHLKDVLILKLQIAQIDKTKIAECFIFNYDTVSSSLFSAKLTAYPFNFNSQDSALLSDFLIKKPLASKKAISKFCDFIGNYCIYPQTEAEKLLKKIQKNHANLDKLVAEKFKKKDANNDGIIGLARFKKIMNKHSSMKKDDIVFIIYYCQKSSKDISVINYINAIETIEGRQNTKVLEMEKSYPTVTNPNPIAPTENIMKSEPMQIKKDTSIVKEEPIAPNAQIIPEEDNVDYEEYNDNVIEENEPKIKETLKVETKLLEENKPHITEEKKSPIVEEKKSPIVEKEKYPIIEENKSPLVENVKSPSVGEQKSPICLLYTSPSPRDS